MVYANPHTLEHKGKIGETQADQKESQIKKNFLGSSYFGPCNGKMDRPNYLKTFDFWHPLMAHLTLNSIADLTYIIYVLTVAELFLPFKFPMQVQSIQAFNFFHLVVKHPSGLRISS